MVTQKLNWKAEPKIGSLTNAKHQPKGGDVKVRQFCCNLFNLKAFKIPIQKVKLDGVQSKIGSLANAEHKPGGGNVDIKGYKVPDSHNNSIGNSADNSRRSSANPSRMI